MTMYPMEYYEFFISFNSGDYYTCHDLLEEIWMTDKQNLFLKGLLQMSVALYHYEYGNVKGARSMMSAAHMYLSQYQPMYWNLHLEKVILFIEDSLSIIPQQIDHVSYCDVETLPQLGKLYLYLENDSL